MSNIMMVSGVTVKFVKIVAEVGEHSQIHMVMKSVSQANAPPIRLSSITSTS